MEIRMDFSEYRPWSGAVETMNRIESEGKMDELETLLEDWFCGDIPTATQVNDLLWFESDDVYKRLGMKPDNVDEYDLEDIESEWCDENGRSRAVATIEGGVVHIEWTDVDEETGDTDESGEEDLDEDDIARLFNADHAEITDTGADTWDDD